MSNVKTRRKNSMFGALAVLTIGLGCNTHLLPTQGPDFRGITIPLPPPSYHGVDSIAIDVEGTIPGGKPGQGTIVHLWESVAAGGETVPAEDNGDFIFEDYLVYPNQSCLELEYYWTEAGQHMESMPNFFQVLVFDGAEMCDDNDLCSDRADDDSCLCLEPRNDGC